ncbi:MULTISPECIES: mechanosensitive ion channel family protein [unclassified Imperialibacter]|uniref:mechanosensitive ion channel family protein n=1 Tax=unclassified Imperialibacter TaxID=2629706 RepID=UPI0012528CB0|nr:MULTISPECIES: mechanosensitive ion channel family protein [unclassified Imperialibacter]CAD5279044.1 MscS family membrane protein [Imperialibacter sp. 89]CAD5293142.1 MscS family membrane protein [Imperialibacter sp. 75]VVS99097.1 Mechanosensitive ion channel protein [Imperialibacter sp. EC-SDR9]
MRKLFLIVLSVLLYTSTTAQSADNPISDSVSFKTPYQSIYTFLRYLQEDSYYPELAAGIVKQTLRGSEEAQEVVVQLKQVLDGEGHFIYLEDLPNDPDYTDTVSRQNRYVLVKDYPNIYLEKYNDKWLLAEKSVREIGKLHEKVFPFGTDKLLNLLPKLGTKKYLGLQVWQLVGILVLILGCVLIHKLLTFLFEKIIMQALLRAGYERLADEYILPVARPVSLFVVFLLLFIFIPVLQLPPGTMQYVVMGVKAALPFFGTMVFYHLVEILCVYLQRLALKTKSTLDDQLVPLVRRALKIFVVLVGGLFILDNLNIPILPLLTGLSIGGLAFALAAQDTIKNLFGSLMIFIDKPFQIGDWITSGDIDGSVEEVGFRSTRIRTFRNSLTYVPNGKLADAMIDNHGLRVYRRYYTKLSITYDTPPPLIETFVEGLKEIVKTHPMTRKDYIEISFNEFGPSSLNIMFYMFFEVPTWSEELQGRHEINLEIMKLAEHLGINFAFPTQTLHIENMPGKPSLSPTYEVEKAGERMRVYFGSQKNEK